MPDPERLLHTLRRATQAFRETPGRRGRLVHLDGAAEVFVAGDLHGQVENVRLLLQKADLARQPGRHLVLQEVIHGPFQYPTGGDKSHQLLDLVAALKSQFPDRVHFLLGNHELSQFTDRPVIKNDADLNRLFVEGVEAAYGSRAREVYAAYAAMLACVPVALRTPNRIFLSHSLPSAARLADFNLAILERDAGTDDLPLRPGGTIYALVWGRDTSPANAEAFLRLVDADLLITGHVPCEHGWAAPNDRQLILDSLGAPACYCLFPADRPLTHDQLIGCVHTL